MVRLQTHPVWEPDWLAPDHAPHLFVPQKENGARIENGMNPATSDHM